MNKGFAYPVGLPSPFAYMHTKAQRFCKIGPEKYRKSDALGMPNEDWPTEILDAISRGMTQVCEFRGWTQETPFEGIGIPGFYALMETLHFDCESQSLVAQDASGFLGGGFN